MLNGELTKLSNPGASMTIKVLEFAFQHYGPMTISADSVLTFPLHAQQYTPYR